MTVASDPRKWGKGVLAETLHGTTHVRKDDARLRAKYEEASPLRLVATIMKFIIDPDNGKPTEAQIFKHLG